MRWHPNHIDQNQINQFADSSCETDLIREKISTHHFILAKRKSINWYRSILYSRFYVLYALQRLLWILGHKYLNF